VFPRLVKNSVLASSLVLLGCLLGSLSRVAVAFAEEAAPPSEKTTCEAIVDNVARPPQRARLKAFCEKIERLPTCSSKEGRPIQHADFMADDPRGKRILVLGMIHGDEPLAGEMALEWGTRLKTIGTARNSWRVVPMLNPDGRERNTRQNAAGVDLNRNFPTKDWDESAHPFWQKTSGKDPRRNPGDVAASEAETKCIIQHIKDFKPDFIVSVHTPYHVLDFDGPKMGFPAYKDLPWRALGNFPGSLGRYMWKDYSVPVLTVELGNTMVDAARLQDIVGTFAIEAAKRSGQKTAGMFEGLK
jgi:murein peptide amidase A